LIAVSGGADSVALLHLLHKNRDVFGIESIAVAHVNHGLRGSEADLDEALVQSMAGSLSLPFFTQKLSGITLATSGLEEYCRSERYAFFHHLKKKHHFDYIVTAHTADDQAETLLMRIIRGCGIRGLTGVHELRDDAVIRPLLGITKNDLLCFLKSSGITWREDHTNSDVKYLRNNIRHNVLPMLETLNPKIREHLVTLGKSAAGAMSIVEAHYIQWKAKFVLDESESHFELRRDGFSDTGISECVFRMLSDRGVACSNQNIIYIIDNSCATSGRFLISDGWSMFGARNSLFFLKDGSVVPAVNETVAHPGETQICNGHIRIIFQHSDTFDRNADKNTAYIDSAFLNGSLVLRTVESGDRFIPLGRTNEVSVLSFLESQGYSKIDRERMLVLMNGLNVVWIPGIRLSDCVKVTNSTKSITKISFQLHAHIL
jgi:tRNA(Ile)-lysidine synthase